MIQKSEFGLIDNRRVDLYRITNRHGEYAEVLSYGASLHSLFVLDRNGNLGDVVLGAGDVRGFAGFSTEGVVVGRCANRIADAKYTIDGKTYQLEPGRGGHCLHSGSSNYAKQHFEASVDEIGNSVTFYLEDTGDCGFDCMVHACITYSFTDDHQLAIVYHLAPEGTTLLSPTNHAYFNLGEADARDHVLQLHADRYAVKSERGLPEGEVADVCGTYMDFTKPRSLRSGFEQLPRREGMPLGYDDNFILRDTGFREVSVLTAPASGREMRVYTDMPAMVLFAGALPMDLDGKNGNVYRGHCFVCMETQYVSNAVNCEGFQKPIFHKGETLTSKTVYAFGVV